MGKGRIVSGGEGGLYTVELLHNRERIQQELTVIAVRLAELEAEEDGLEAERGPLVDENAAIATQIDLAIASTEPGEMPDVEALLVELARLSVQIQSLDVRIGMIDGRILEANARKKMLESVPDDPIQQAWCADYTEDLTGEVATVEVPAEGVVGQFLTWRRAQIRPGYSGRATYTAARDGQMHHREGQISYQAFYNAAILPGVQRWRPQYRIGVITAIDTETDTCSLTIQGEDSSAQSLIIDPPDLQYTKTGVPIEYMSCNAEAFEVGDRVLIEFQSRDWSQPKVIGFETEPRECVLWPPFVRVLLTTAISDVDYDGGSAAVQRSTNWVGGQDCYGIPRGQTLTARSGSRTVQVVTVQNEGAMHPNNPNPLSIEWSVESPQTVYYTQVWTTFLYNFNSCDTPSQVFCTVANPVQWQTNPVTNRIDIIKYTHSSSLITVEAFEGGPAATGYDVSQMTAFSAGTTTTENIFVSGDAAAIYNWLVANGAPATVRLTIAGGHKDYVRKEMLQSSSNLWLLYEEPE